MNSSPGSMVKRLAILLGIVSFASCSLGQSHFKSSDVDAYLRPYVQSNNFAGVVLIEKDGKVVLQKAYGLADHERRLPNSIGTRFHIASLSMQFTAAAILRLVDTGTIKLDDHVGDLLPGIKGAERVTIRDLLTERSGLPDINTFPNYTELLKEHQTPTSLVAAIQGHALLFEPGSKFLREEHSAYNLLALIVERKTGLPFAASLKKLILHPAGLKASGADDDFVSEATPMAKGYEPDRASGLKPAASIHWSAKTGNASIYTTAGDEARWVDAVFRGKQLSASSRQAVLDTSMRVGYGWFKAENPRFGQVAYYMNGRAPGFASFVLYLPRAQTTVVVLSNIYSSATTTIGYDIAAVALGLKYEPFRIGEAVPADELTSCTGTFQFGPDFYQPNAKVGIVANDGELSLRWPSDEYSSLIPLERDRFMDRSYWENVRIERDSAGQPARLIYGDFKGTASSK